MEIFTLNTKHLQKVYFILLITQLFLSCSGSKTKTNAIRKNVDYLIEHGQLNWQKREDSLSLARASHFIGLAHQKRPNDYQTAILYSRILFTRALNTNLKPKLRDSLFYIGSKISKEATLSHTDFKSIYNLSKGDSTFKLYSSIADAPENLIPGLYWWATNQSYYLFTRPVIERINNRELLEVIMHRINSLNPDYHYGGTSRFFGRLYTRLPGVDISKSEQYFNQAIAYHPNYFGNAVQMAEFYHQKKGNREFFHKQLLEVINRDPYDYPDSFPENIFYQKYAKYLIENEAALFE
tara:strand:- start:21357 stop:22241 length:885 start_codon:yes stop_codon:yes gene_type:complete